jgi:hypothetical protein
LFSLLEEQQDMERFMAPGEAKEGRLEGPFLVPPKAPDHPGVLVMSEERDVQAEAIPGKEENLA